MASAKGSISNRHADEFNHFRNTVRIGFARPVLYGLILSLVLGAFLGFTFSKRDAEKLQKFKTSLLQSGAPAAVELVQSYQRQRKWIESRGIAVEAAAFDKTAMLLFGSANALRAFQASS